MNYAQHVSTKVTPQSEAIPGKPMEQNNAGGFSFTLDDWKRLDRFLILGSEGGTYYVGEKELTKDNAQVVMRCIQQDGVRTVLRIVEISDQGRAPKNDPAIFALALCCSFGDAKTKGAAFDSVRKVCRIGTHIFQFAAACDQLRGWGKGLQKAIGKWYTDQTPRNLAYQVTKYQERNGWSHRDLLRLCHVKVRSSASPRDAAQYPGLQAVLRWVVRGIDGMGPVSFDRKVKGEKVKYEYPAADAILPMAIAAFEKIKKADTPKQAAELIRAHNIVRECIPTQFLTSPEVWDALLQNMPLTAMIRNLGTMTKVGLLAPFSEAVKKVVSSLEDYDYLKKSRVHPLSVLVAMKTYAQGHGEKGNSTWSPVQQVVDALDGAFYKTFGNVEPTGKRWLLGLDVSGSMGGSTVSGTSLTAREASAAMALITATTEKDHHIVGFTGRGFSVTGNQRPSPFGGFFGGRSNSGVEPLNISPRMRLNDVIGAVSGLPFGPTDCALPMLYAMEKNLPVDGFVVYTDNETWHGTIHPVQALKQYRDKTGIPAKLIVVGMTVTQFTIADPSDPGMLDIVGFDTATPQVMSEFVKG